MVDLFYYQREQLEEMNLWSSAGYLDCDCPNCGRSRVERCANGKSWCEKCNWVIEDECYFIPEWRV